MMMMMVLMMVLILMMKVSIMIMSRMTVIIIVIAMRSIAVIVEKDSVIFHMRIDTMNYQYSKTIYTLNRELKIFIVLIQYKI